MKKCENTYLSQQCISMKASIQNFKLGLKLASVKDDGITDKNESKMIREITKDLDRLQKTLDSYEYV